MSVKSDDVILYKNRHADPEFHYKINGIAQNISAGGLIFSVVDGKEDASPLFERKNSAAGGGDSEISWVTDGTDGKFYVHFVPTNTSGLDAGEYLYEVKLELNSKDTTIGEGNLVLKETWAS